MATDEDALTPGDIIEKAAALMGTEIDLPDGLAWINECSRRYINPSIRLDGYKLIVTDGSTYYPVPTDMYGNSMEVLRLDGVKLNKVSVDVEELAAGQFYTWDNNIYLKSSTVGGKLEIWYRKRVRKVTAADSPLDLPNDYSDLYQLFICWKYQQQDEEPDLEDDYKQEFLGSLEMFVRERGKSANRGRTTQWGVSRI